MVDLIHVKHNVIFDTGIVEAGMTTPNCVAVKGLNLSLVALILKNLNQRTICRFEIVSVLHVRSPEFSAAPRFVTRRYRHNSLQLKQSLASLQDALSRNLAGQAGTYERHDPRLLRPM